MFICICLVIGVFFFLLRGIWLNLLNTCRYQEVVGGSGGSKVDQVSKGLLEYDRSF